MKREELKQRIGAIVSDTNMSGNEKRDLILDLFDVRLLLPIEEEVDTPDFKIFFEGACWMINNNHPIKP